MKLLNTKEMNYVINNRILPHAETKVWFYEVLDKLHKGTFRQTLEITTKRLRTGGLKI